MVLSLDLCTGDFSSSRNKPERLQHLGHGKGRTQERACPAAMPAGSGYHPTGNLLFCRRISVLAQTES
jgi:hypothetical protein